MPGVVENHRKWSEHNWEHGGHRWSPGGTATGTAMMWARTVRPRLMDALPTGVVLEIAPGHGRWTTWLLAESARLIGVDITPQCVDICRERFSAGTAEFFVNDGASLPMVASHAIDFAFSLDSLVHVEAPQIRSYLHELARTLRPGGRAFLHHSNLAAYVDARGHVGAYVGERHWRAPSMSARVFREACREAGLRCETQELINWIGRDAEVDRHRLPGEQIALTDCLSTCVRTSEGADAFTRLLVNRRFVEEWRELIVLSSVYPRSHADRAYRPGETRNAPLGRLFNPGVTAGSPSVRATLARARARWRGRRFAAQEPIVKRLQQGTCPDCHGVLTQGAGAPQCERCRVEFYFQ